MSQIADGKVTLQLIRPERCRVLYQIMKENEPIGEIELDHIAWRSGEAELKISIPDEKLQNHGYGTAAVAALLKLAFQKMNLNRVYLRVYAQNTIALHCYRKTGFKKEGRLHRRNRHNTLDEIFLMSITKTEFMQDARINPRAV